VKESQSRLEQLPPGWAHAQLGDIAEVILGQSPPSSTYNESGKGLPFYQGKLEFGKLCPTPRKWCAAPIKIAEKGDVLISVRAPVGPTNICPEKSCIGRGLAAIRGLGGIGTLFVLYLLRVLESEIARKGTGTTFSAIGGGQLRGVKVPLPPLNEQVRIVARLEELFARLDVGVEELQKVKAQLKRYRQAVLKYAFEGKLTEEWRKTHKDQIEPQILFQSEDVAVPKLPENWASARFGDVTKIIDYRGRTPPFSSQGIPHIRSSNVRDGRILLSGLKYVSKEAFDKYMTRGLPHTNDLLFTTEAPLGEVALVPEFAFSLAQRLMILRPQKAVLNSKFLLYQIMSPEFQGRLRGKGTGTTVTGVSSRNLKPIRILVAPLAEQEKIGEEIEKVISIIETMDSMVGTGFRQAVRLRQSILKSAFEGKLVPQDPSDEPAERLLGRVRADKAKSKGEKDTNRRNKSQLELSTYVK